MLYALPATSCSFGAPAPPGARPCSRLRRRRQLPERVFEPAAFTVCRRQYHRDPRAGPEPTAIGTTTTATVTVAGRRLSAADRSRSRCSSTPAATRCARSRCRRRRARSRRRRAATRTVASQYGGDASYASGLSNVVTMTVAPVPPVVTLVSVAPNPTAVGTATTATVTSAPTRCSARRPARSRCSMASATRSARSRCRPRRAHSRRRRPAT